MKQLIDISKLQKSKNYTVDWKPRSKVFKRGNLAFDPSSMVATSYRWYNIAQLIKGKLVLNTYRYSSSTGKHISQLRSLFSQLGLKYLVLEAPKGLQNLDRARSEELSQWAESEVRFKYSRNPGKPSFKIANLDALNIKYTKKEQLIWLSRAEQERQERLAKQKRERAIKAVTVEIVEREDLSSVNDALIIHPHDSRYISTYEKRAFQVKALEAGFKKVIVNVVLNESES